VETQTAAVILFTFATPGYKTLFGVRKITKAYCSSESLAQETPFTG
jgi:hypothetical protein